MREPPVIVTLALAVLTTLAISVIVFPAAAWLFPLEGRTEDDLVRVLRNSGAVLVTLIASHIAQGHIRKLYDRGTDKP